MVTQKGYTMNKVLINTSILLISLIISIAATSAQTTLITRETKLGSVKGLLLTVEREGSFVNISSYLGLPYALPPVGERRLLRPDVKGVTWGYEKESGPSSEESVEPEPEPEAEPDDGNASSTAEPAPEPSVFDATSFKSACMQKSNSLWITRSGQNVKLSEDCLYLNVFTPDTEADSNTTYPVLVLLHGGDWSSGGAQNHNAPVLAAAGLVVVTMEYRLGMLGYSGSSNLGLQDQTAALRWVADNVDEFGGDTARITLVGAGGAGAQAVIVHALAGRAGGLFNQAVILSDSRDLFVPVSDKPLPVSVPSCEDELKDCAQLVEAVNQDTTEWGPVIGGNMVSRDINKRFATGKFPDIPILIGSPAAEFGPVPPNTSVSVSGVRADVVDILTEQYGEEEADLVAELTLWEYARNGDTTLLYNVPNQVLDQQASVYVRAVLLNGATSAAARNSISSTYRYVLGKPGVNHADLLAPPIQAPPLLPDEKIMGERLMGIVQDFVAKSEPGLSLPAPANAWVPITPEEAPYFELSASSIPRLTSDIFPPRADFWDKHVPGVLKAARSDPEADNEADPEGNGAREGSVCDCTDDGYFIATWVLLALVILLLILLIVVLVVLLKHKRDSYNMDREGTVQYVAK